MGTNTEEELALLEERFESARARWTEDPEEARRYPRRPASSSPKRRLTRLKRLMRSSRAVRRWAPRFHSARAPSAKREETRHDHTDFNVPMHPVYADSTIPSSSSGMDMETAMALITTKYTNLTKIFNDSMDSEKARQKVLMHVHDAQVALQPYAAGPSIRMA